MMVSYAQLLLFHCNPLGLAEGGRLSEEMFVPVLFLFVEVSDLFRSNSAQNFLFFSSSGGLGSVPVAGTKRDTTVLLGRTAGTDLE
jgi:hypothetical protein